MASFQDESTARDELFSSTVLMGEEDHIRSGVYSAVLCYMESVY